MDLGENHIMFRISRDGKVTPFPEASVFSTSHEMQLVLQEVAREAAKFIERLLREKVPETRLV